MPASAGAAADPDSPAWRGPAVAASQHRLKSFQKSARTSRSCEGRFGTGVLVAPLGSAIGLDAEVVFAVGLAEKLLRSQTGQVQVRSELSFGIREHAAVRVQPPDDREIWFRGGADRVDCDGSTLSGAGEQPDLPAGDGATSHSFRQLLAGEQFEQAVGGVVGKHELVVPVGFGGELPAPGEEGLLVLGQCSFGVAGVGGDG